MIAAFGAVFWFVGCQTAPTQRPVMASSEPGAATVATVTVPEPLVVAVPAPLPSPETAPALPADAIVPPISENGSTWPKEWINAWVPLESWGKFNGFDKPVQLSGGSEAVFHLQTTNGAMILRIGSQTVNFAGQQYWLGFAPRLIKGLPYVHSLDAQKTLQVLLNALFPLPVTNRTVVVDAGHGGRDVGTRGAGAHELEKHYTLDWALRLERLLSANGWNVILTRSNDVDVSLSDRVALADRVKADLFLSLHFNSGNQNRELSGLETFCLTPTGMPSDLRREYDDDPREAHPNNLFDEQNLQLATRLHRSLLQASGAIDRGIRHARFMAVLRGQRRPSVLIEGGYLSNPAEAKKIASPEYRQLLAEGIARALE